MNEVEKIFSCLSKTDKVLVFTSETAARNVLTAYTEKNPGKAVFFDRVMSWDRFLLSLLDTEGKRAVTKTERKIFAYSFLKNGGLEKLEYFASSDFPESITGYASGISRELEFLPAPSDTIRDELPSSMLHDIDLIRESYTAFLEERNLYEKRYLKPDYSKIEVGKYIFVFPETFTSTLTSSITSTGKVDVIPVPSSSHIPLIERENSLSEIREMMREIEIDRKTYPDTEIAVTSSSLSTYRPYLESEAARMDIPLVFTSSLKLSDYPEGRFIKALYNTYKSNWSFRETERLLLDPVFPFKDRCKLVTIIRSAVDGRLEEGGIRSWMSVLKGEEKELFLNISSSLERIVKSHNPELTLRYLKEFRDTYFIENKWNEEEDRVFGSILELLTASGDEPLDDLFRLFIYLLDETEYVEKTEETSGIRVYAYPASAGLITKVHYIIGLDDNTTERKLDDYPFLTTGEREEISITESILDLYSSTVFTDKTVITGTTSGIDGARLLPPYFLGRTVKSKEEASDRYKDERKYWIEGIKPERRPYPGQSRAFSRAAGTSLVGRNAKVKLKSFAGEEISLSVSRVKDFDLCPYRGYASSRLKLKEKDYSPVLEDPRATGEILHSTVEKALDEAGTIGNIDQERLEYIFLKELDDAFNKRKITTKSTYMHIKGKYIDKLSSIQSSTKAAVYSGYALAANEKKIEGYPLTGKITINGRIDTLLKDENGGLYIIDWKTGGGSDYSPSSLDDTSIQVILYALLLSGDVLGGAFYSFRDANYRIVWPQVTYRQKNGVSRTEGYSKEAVLLNSEERLEKISSAINEGDFTPTARAKNCLNCSYRGLCRSTFGAGKEKDDDR